MPCHLSTSSSISSTMLRRKLNSLALSRHTQLLEILEIPQVMETCVRNGYYEEALDLNNHVKRVEKRHGGIPIIKVGTTRGLITMSRGLKRDMGGSL